MSNIEQATAAKGRGNKAFAAGDFETAVTEFSAAIEFNPDDHVFYSNRSGAYASMGKYDEALVDAEACIKTNPAWAKGYSRKGLALLNLKQAAEAKAAYTLGLTKDPNNAALKQGLADAERAEQSAGNPMSQLFGEGMWAKLQMDPTTREFLKDPAFVQKMKMMQSNPNMMSSMGSDPQLSAALGVILGLGSSGFSSMNAGDMPNKDEDGDVPMQSSPKDAAVEEEEEEVEEVDLELEAEKRVKAQALDEKAKGNGFYKKKQFEEALACYNKAIELDPDNSAFQTNKAAVYYEMKDYEQCIQICSDVVKAAKATKCYDYQVVAKAYHRIGNAYEKQAKYTEAIEAQQNALMEHPLPAAKSALKKLATKKKEAEALAYLSEEKSEDAKARGNECFKAGKWTDAIEEYNDALKRNPDNYRVYSNRAACYSKLMDWQRGLDDCDKCLEMDPQFVKAYIRKAKIQHFLKQYHKALETYERGLAIDPKASELIEGRQQTMRAINAENQSGQVDPARAKEAMKDPEIQSILQDPLINKVLQDMQNDPATGQKALQDPTIMAKIQKLIAAGILQVGNK